MAFDVKADLTSQTARINYDKTKVDINDMEEVINSLGFEVLGIDGQLEVNEDEIYKNDLKDKRNRIVVGFTASAILMILMYVHWMPFGLSMGVVSLIISIVPFLYVSLPTLKAGFNGIIHKNLNIPLSHNGLPNALPDSEVLYNKIQNKNLYDIVLFEFLDILQFLCFHGTKSYLILLPFIILFTYYFIS